ncbi:sensor histidine kinase [Nibribacter ruber]|uniref:histidine kinase n=1 Tax=Nibribacter ruber TaxID=2698458 RepID=A0A6P1P469_9BACT|nr:HAMP domain-containing sensor histidine kinase [Nibribacter ruber]QHL89244.1 sensor histidine kinase [Nibribacter ruber]
MSEKTQGLRSFLKSKWVHLVGSAAEFPMEQRVYNTFCLITILGVAYNIPFNIITGLYGPFFVTIFLLGLVTFAFYLSRFKGRYILSFAILSISIHAGLGINYFFNDGITGPTLVLLALFFFPILVVATKKYYWLWTTMNVGLILSLALAEYYFPNLIVGRYLTRETRFIDMITTYLIVILLIRVCTVFLLNHYNRARLATEEANKALQKLNQEKTKLLSIISHDLRAPLANIQGYLQILSQAEIPQEQRLQINNQLLQNTQTTLDMLTNVLAWSKSHMDGGQKSLDSVNVRQALSSTLELFKDIAHRKDIALAYTLEEDVQIMSEVGLLQLVVRNLVNNAIKFTNPGGAISVSAVKNGDNLLLQVKDSGNGQPALLSPDIFLLNSGTSYGTHQEKGVGLGLVLCREFVAFQKGRIWFESHPVSGVSFFVEVPLVPAERTAVASAAFAEVA